MVAAGFPAATLHLTDISEAMLAEARRRFADAPRVTFSVQDHLQLSAVAEYDLALSALSVHHLEHDGKQELFHRVYRALRPGGVFINADQALGPTAQEEDEYERQWLAHVTASGVSAASLEAARARMRDDKSALLSDQMTWLSEAGFTDVRCPYARGRFVVYAGTK